MIDIENVRREIKRLEHIEADLRAKLDAKLDKVKYWLALQKAIV